MKWMFIVFPLVSQAAIWSIFWAGGGVWSNTYTGPFSLGETVAMAWFWLIGSIGVAIFVNRLLKE